MKKVYTFIMLLSFGSLTFVGCGVARNSTKSGSTVGGTVVKSVATIVGIILLSKLLKSVLNTIGGSKSFTAVAQNQSFISNFNEDTKLASFANNDLMKTALQVLVAEHYRIPLSTVAKNYSSLNTAGDLATFIGQHADAKVLEAIK